MLIDQKFYRQKLLRAIEAYKAYRRRVLADDLPPGDSAMQEIRQRQKGISNG